MRKTSTLISRLPKFSGKACAQFVGSLWVSRGQNSMVLHTPSMSTIRLWKTSQISIVLYTNCIQVLQVLVGNFTSVSKQFYTVCTGPITTTTTFIYKRGTL